MKRVISILIAVLLLSGTAYAALYAEQVTYAVMVNGDVVRFTDDDGLPVNISGRTFLPVRAVANALNIPIDWKNNRVEIQTLDIERLKDSCVMVVAGTEDRWSQGSGVLIDYDEILTAYHVVDGYNQFQVFYDNCLSGEYCNLAKTATKKDAAVLTPSDKTVKPVKIGDSDEVKIGDKIYVVSSPQGEKNIVTVGTVTWYGDAPDSSYKAFGINAKVDAGSSGGACFNITGELIGIAVGVNETGKLCFVVPINHIRQALAN